jgi:hypothetical protein
VLLVPLPNGHRHRMLTFCDRHLTVEQVAAESVARVARRATCILAHDSTENAPCVCACLDPAEGCCSSGGAGAQSKGESVPLLQPSPPRARKTQAQSQRRPRASLGWHHHPCPSSAQRGWPSEVSLLPASRFSGRLPAPPPPLKPSFATSCGCAIATAANNAVWCVRVRVCACTSPAEP